MTYQHPLHYLLGLQGLALLRAFAGDWPQDFADARVADVRRLLDDLELAASPGVDAQDASTVDGYRRWSTTYDLPGNGLYSLEEPWVRERISQLPVGVALDAACGTGRHSDYLADRGHQVIGVDSSAEMLAHAGRKVPGADWRLGDLDRLPVPDDHVDLVVCGLALAHLPSLTAAFAEFARVLRPGGHLITTDIHAESVLMGSVSHVRSEDGQPMLIPSYRHRLSDYLAAALPHGFVVRDCAEPNRFGMIGDPDAKIPDRIDVPEWDSWPWTLQSLSEAATRGAWTEVPALTMWHFQLPDA